MGFIIFFQQWLRYIVTIIFVSKNIIFYLSYPIYKYRYIHNMYIRGYSRDNVDIDRCRNDIMLSS
jgi:hypothetical protein